METKEVSLVQLPYKQIGDEGLVATRFKCGERNIDRLTRESVEAVAEKSYMKGFLEFIETYNYDKIVSVRLEKFNKH